MWISLNLPSLLNGCSRLNAVQFWNPFGGVSIFPGHLLADLAHDAPEQLPSREHVSTSVARSCGFPQGITIV